MRIDPKRLSEVARKTVESIESERVEPAGATAGQPVGPAQADQVTLSQGAAEVQRAQQALGEVPEVRQEKVAEAKRKIVEGTLEIDSEQIARNIIEGGI